MATYSQTLDITSEGTIEVTLNRWTATINLTTSSEDFFGKEIKVTKNGSDVGTISFDQAGNASIEVHEAAAYVFSLTYVEGETYSTTITVTAQETYTGSLNRWTATIRLYTAETVFRGQSLNVTKGEDSLGTVTIGNDGYAYYLAHEAGTYNFTLNYSAKEGYTISAEAIEDTSTVDITLTRYTATINIGTTTSTFTNWPIKVQKDGVDFDDITFASTTSTTKAYEVHYAGTYRFIVTVSDSEVYTRDVVINTNGQSESIIINRWTATINLSTTSSDFYGHEITVTKDGEAVTGTAFSATGSAVYEAHAAGEYIFTVTYENEKEEQEVYTATVQVSAQTTYSGVINRYTATIQLSTSSEELIGATITVYKGNDQYDTVTLPSTTGTNVNYAVHSAGSWKFALTYDGTEYSAIVDVTTSGATYIANISLKPALVAWTSGSDEEIKAMIDGYYDGKVTLDEIKSVQSLGDVRKVSLSAMSATGVSENHRAQDVEFEILGFDHDTLTTPINGITKALVTVEQKTCLMAAGINDTNGSSNSEHGYMNSSNTNNGGWRNCARRTWCNNVYYNALPDGFKSMVKQVNKLTSAGNQSSTINTDADYCQLPSEIEIFGSVSYSKSGEGTQYAWYAQSTSNRNKSPHWGSSHVSDRWWERSPYGSNATYFCHVNYNGNAGYNIASYAYGVAPACCL